MAEQAPPNADKFDVAVEKLKALEASVQQQMNDSGVEPAKTALPLAPKVRHLCQLCESNPVAVQCVECSTAQLCLVCDDDLHRSDKFAHHTRTPWKSPRLDSGRPPPAPVSRQASRPGSAVSAPIVAAAAAPVASTPVPPAPPAATPSVARRPSSPVAAAAAVPGVRRPTSPVVPRAASVAPVAPTVALPVTALPALPATVAGIACPRLARLLVDLALTDYAAACAAEDVTYDGALVAVCVCVCVEGQRLSDRCVHAPVLQICCSLLRRNWHHWYQKWAPGDACGPHYTPTRPRRPWPVSPRARLARGSRL